ncbi:unnamed protein product [Vitrella brassicaformis CCMP3155]|uniref:Uncharacterized protein n=2 Tax=Vitrella brassicaformis TaxID=1169539 RepID=A0A0G4G965_VITBC|nr:unnamed protein product [Vitrella brassicaformis CCMP3155]|eukprot:CEM25374.1 unnamed protein product [Vitrella brassicaformis CCMP3155]
MSDGADGGKRQRVDGPAASGHGMNGVSSSQHQQMDAAHDASAAGCSLSFEEVQRRFSVLLAQVTQVECDVTTIEGSFVANVAPQVPSVASNWSTLKSSLSATSDALTAITEGMAATHPPQAPPSHPHPSPPDAHAAPTQTTDTTAAADAGTAARRTENRLPSDLYCDHIVGFLPISDAICPARAANTFYGTELVDENFVLGRIDTDLGRRSLRGLIDVQRPTLEYYTKCAHTLEYGGVVWCEWADFIRLADIYKLTDDLPLIMSTEWMAQHFRSKADFHSMPAALRQYSTFGHLLNYKGTSLALTKLDEADDGGEGKKDKEEAEPMEEDDGGEGQGNGDGEEDREGEGGGSGQMDEPMEGEGEKEDGQRYRIGVGEHQWEFETVPLSGLPPRHPFRRTYDPHNPPIRYLARYRHGLLFPSFTAFIRRMVLAAWCGQEGVGEKRAFRVGRVDGGDERYQKLLTGTIEDLTTIDLILETNDERVRQIVLKGMKEGDSIAARLLLGNGYIELYTNEARIEGQERLPDRFPIAMSLVRPLLTKHGLAHLIPQ